MISVTVSCYVLVFVGGPQVPKSAQIDQEIAFLIMWDKPCENTFGRITIC